MAQMGRKTKYSEALVKSIEECLHAGMSIKKTCTFVRLAESTFHAWMNSRKKKEFSERVRTAQAKQVRFLLGSLINHGKTDWRAHAWLLERCHPEDYGNKCKILGTGKDGAVRVEQTERELTSEERLARINQLARELKAYGVPLQLGEPNETDSNGERACGAA